MRNRQQGIGYLGYMVLAVIVGVVVKVVSTAAGPYIDHYYIGRSVKSVMNENASNNISVADFKVAMSTQFQVNSITDQSPGDLTYVKEGNKFTVTDDYEVRKPFMGNCDVVFKFKDTYVSEETAGAQ